MVFVGPHMRTGLCRSQGATLVHENRSLGQVAWQDVRLVPQWSVADEECRNDVVYEYNQIQMEECVEELDEETAFNIAVVESLLNSDDASPSGGEACAALPDFCALHSMEPGGWCFYDSILAHLPQPLPHDIHRYSLVGAILECVARRRDALEDQLLHEDDDTTKRREDVLNSGGESLYLRVLDQLDAFDYYVLSKLEVGCEHRPVLDTCHYADYPEISSFLNVCGLALLRVRPPATWATTSVGSVFFFIRLCVR